MVVDCRPICGPHPGPHGSGFLLIQVKPAPRHKATLMRWRRLVGSACCPLFSRWPWRPARSTSYCLRCSLHLPNLSCPVRARSLALRSASSLLSLRVMDRRPGLRLQAIMHDPSSAEAHLFHASRRCVDAVKRPTPKGRHERPGKPAPTMWPSYYFACGGFPHN